MVGWLAACAGVPPTALTERPGAVVPDAPFSVDGRLSARHGGEAMSANFSWTHAPPRDELAVTTPLGQDVAQISGDGRSATVTLADGRAETATDWATLTERALGFALPVAGLSAWIRGGAHPGSPSSVEPDAEGRAAVLRQDGWEIVYGYPDAASATPKSLRLVYGDLEVRVVVDRWRA
jgi:outer membrane lipoprotein LolB